MHKSHCLSQRYHSFAASTLILLSTLLASCGGGDTRSDVTINPSVPVPEWWETITPDFSDNSDRPVITLNGSNMIHLNVGESYQEEGASALDKQNSDLTANLTITGEIDSSKGGDYLVRYSVADSSQLAAIEKVRIVRVYDQTPSVFNYRPVGSTASHLGYIEHLPANYAADAQQKLPLLIFNHGSGSNAVVVQGTPNSALESVYFNGGPPLLIGADRWYEEDSFVVLVPQMADLQMFDPIERFSAFMDYARSTYNIDESRIYITGWSQGGFLSLAYAQAHPEKVAAVISVSGGLVSTSDLPADFCEIENVPIWVFHGAADEVVPVQSSIESVEVIKANCQPPIAPRLSVLLEQPHSIHHSIFNLTSMQGGSLGHVSDPNFDLYDQNLFEWLLSHSLENR